MAWRLPRAGLTAEHGGSRSARRVLASNASPSEAIREVEMRERMGYLMLMLVFAALGADARSVSALDDDEVIPCAEHISSGEDDEPLVGNLVGTSDITVTVKSGGSISADIDFIEGSAGGEVSRTIEYQIGFYLTGDGEMLAIDCRTYELLS